MIAEEVDIPRFDPTKDKLPGWEHTAAGHCMCGGEYYQTLLQKTGNKLCTSCGQYIPSLDPSLNQLISVELGEYVRRARRNHILIAILTNFSVALIAIYFINTPNVNKWLVWALMISFSFAVRAPTRRLAHWLSRPKRKVDK